MIETLLLILAIVWGVSLVLIGAMVLGGYWAVGKVMREREAAPTNLLNDDSIYIMHEHTVGAAGKEG